MLPEFRPMKSLSIIIPLYNEKQSLPELHRALSDELTKIDMRTEIIYIDDGSTDGSLSVLRELQQSDYRIRIIRFRRNFGKSAALSAGFSISEGDAIITMDADLQDLPSEIHQLLEKLHEGADLVSGWKKERKDPFSKTFPSRIFNFVTSLLTGVPLHDMNCGLKAYRREVIREIEVYGDMHRFIPVLASYRGFLVTEVPVMHRERAYGKSKYGAARLVGGFLDLLTVIMLTRYNRKPLHAFGILGGLMLTGGFIIELYLTIGWFLGRWIEDRPAFMLGILLLIVGMQFIFFGLLAEMVAYSSKRDHDYSIQQVLEPPQISSDSQDYSSVSEVSGVEA
jgi:glycosyltransferase involved in cell wall biosynthesis